VINIKIELINSRYIFTLSSRGKYLTCLLVVNGFIRYMAFTACVNGFSGKTFLYNVEVAKVDTRVIFLCQSYLYNDNLQKLSTCMAGKNTRLVPSATTEQM